MGTNEKSDKICTKSTKITKNDKNKNSKKISPYSSPLPWWQNFSFEFFDEVIKKHEWQNITYIEPYAGGAGAAISLLLLEKVHSIVINDYDPAIYSFWLAIKEHNAEFIERVLNTPITVEKWERQKKVYKHPIHPTGYR